MFSFSGTWKAILKRKCDENQFWKGVFVGFDNSPRKVYKGMIYKKSTPKNFTSISKDCIRSQIQNFYF